MNRRLIPSTTPIKKIRLVLAWLVAAYFANMYFNMGWVKFDPDGFWTGAFERWGYPVWLRYGVGVIEVLGGVLLLVPWISSYAALSVVIVMIGALVTRMLDAHWVDVTYISAYIAGLLWIAFEWWPWRRPQFRRAADTHSSDIAS